MLLLFFLCCCLVCVFAMLVCLWCSLLCVCDVCYVLFVCVVCFVFGGEVCCCCCIVMLLLHVFDVFVCYDWLSVAFLFLLFVFVCL